MGLLCSEVERRIVMARSDFEPSRVWCGDCGWCPWHMYDVKKAPVVAGRVAKKRYARSWCFVTDEEKHAYARCEVRPDDERLAGLEKPSQRTRRV